MIILISKYNEDGEVMALRGKPRKASERLMNATSKRN